MSGEGMEVVAWVRQHSPSSDWIKTTPEDVEFYISRGQRVEPLVRLSDAEARIRELEGREAEMIAREDAVSAAIGSCRWMDPPDGGGPTLAEQVSRMRAELEASEAREAALREALDDALASARRYAACYPAESDGRNTFTLLADRIESRQPKETA